MGAVVYNDNFHSINPLGKRAANGALAKLWAVIDRDDNRDPHQVRRRLNHFRCMSNGGDAIICGIPDVSRQHWSFLTAQQETYATTRADHRSCLSPEPHTLLLTGRSACRNRNRKTSTKYVHASKFRYWISLQKPKRSKACELGHAGHSPAA